ncbi:MAG: hypothetical protein M3N00_02275 [Actinomycetota bacterium]|nr:hypothetical protein [Actinomycetota bacterium]
MKTFHSLPNPGELGFKWPVFDKALARVRRVEQRRAEAEQTATELQQRLASENEADVKRLADAIASGKDDPPPPHLEDLAEALREQQRLQRALEEAGPRAEGELAHAVQLHREEWGGEVDKALEQAIEAERKAYEKAMEPILKARTRRQYLETLAAWVRTTPPVFSPPSDATVAATFSNLAADAERAERQLAERRNQGEARESA